MNTTATTLLLIESDPADAKLIKDALHDQDAAFRMEWVTSLAAALEHLEKHPVEIILLDLALPDGKGLDVFDHIIAAAPDSLILVLSTASDEELRAAALKRGAHDYFTKGYIDAHWLPRALNYVLERKISRSALHDSEARFQLMSEASPLGIFVSDIQGNCIYTNPAYHTISGQTLEETLGTNWTSAIHPEDRLRAITDWGDAVRSGKPFRAEMRFVRKDKSLVWTRLNAAAIRADDTSKKSLGYVQVVEDISESRVMAKKMLHMAQHDFLTGLANRALLTERLTRAIGLAQRKKKQVALMFIDVDNFKQINDSLGHVIGDKLLQSVAARLTDVVRTTDTVCRQGGDEFVVLLTEIEHGRDAAQVAEKIIAAFALPHYIHDQELHITLSIGVSVYPGDGSDVESLFQHADAAMYQAKRAGRNNYQFYERDEKMLACVASRA